jgi:hypothetical protein
MEIVTQKLGDALEVKVKGRLDNRGPSTCAAWRK